MWTLKGVLKSRKRQGSEEPENTDQHQVAMGTPRGEAVEGELTWGVVVQDSITHADLQDESSEQLLHMRQQGIRAGREKRQVSYHTGPRSSSPSQEQMRGSRAPLLLSVGF